MNEPLRLAAQKALSDPAFETKPRLCQRFVRQVLESVYGKEKYTDYCLSSAKSSEKAWKTAGIGFAPDKDTVYQGGDIVYKQYSLWGHVGIVIGRIHLANGDDNWYIAENSSVHKNGVNGAKGVRAIDAFGEITWVVRLPAPDTTA